MSLLSLFAQSSYYSDQYYYNEPSIEGSNAAYAGIFIFALIFALIITITAYVAMAFLLGRIFKKAGIESWKAWVPVYSNWIMLELGGQKGYWAVLVLVPIINIAAVVFMFIAMYHIGLNFGKEGAFVLLAIFLPIVWYIWLAVDSSTWKGSRLVAANSADTNANNHATTLDTTTSPKK
jgi:small-conductance mechanosensitive channel